MDSSTRLHLRVSCSLADADAAPSSRTRVYPPGSTVTHAISLVGWIRKSWVLARVREKRSTATPWNLLVNHRAACRSLPSSTGDKSSTVALPARTTFVRRVTRARNTLDRCAGRYLGVSGKKLANRFVCLSRAEQQRTENPLSTENRVTRLYRASCIATRRKPPHANGSTRASDPRDCNRAQSSMSLLLSL